MCWFYIIIYLIKSQPYQVSIYVSKLVIKDFEVGRIKWQDEFDEWVFDSSKFIPNKLGLCSRTTWMHPINLQSPIDGEYVRTYLKILFKYFHMSVSVFDYVLNIVKSDYEIFNRPICFIRRETGCNVKVSETIHVLKKTIVLWIWFSNCAVEVSCDWNVISRDSIFVPHGFVHCWTQWAKNLWQAIWNKKRISWK